MKRLATIGIIAFAAISLLGADGKAKLTPQQIEERKYRHFGGHIYQRVDTKVVSIVNAQKVLGGDALAKIADEMQGVLMLPVKVDAKDRVGLTLRVCEGTRDGAPLVVMPDNAEATVNVAALSTDGPTPEVLESRVCKELWRGFVYALGGGNTYVQHCVMKQISSLKELDELKTRTACPDAFLRVAESARKLGIMHARRATYRQACKEGWAPQPTNDVQKAIWDEIHAIPDKPITIEYDPKKDK